MLEIVSTQEMQIYKEIIHLRKNTIPINSKNTQNRTHNWFYSFFFFQQQWVKTKQQRLLVKRNYALQVIWTKYSTEDGKKKINIIMSEYKKDKQNYGDLLRVEK